MNMIRLSFFLPFFLSLLAGCASIQSFNMKDVDQKLTKAYQNSDDISANMRDDLSQKKLLVESLTKGKTTAFKEIEADVQIKMTAMEKALQDSEVARKSMASAKADIASLAYSHKKIRGDEPEYSRTEDAVASFQASTESFNQAAANYSRESNSLADLVATKKLFFNFDVSDFLKRAQKAIQVARDNNKLMERELTRTETIINSYAGEEGGLESENVKPLVELGEQMRDLQKTQVERINDMEDLKTNLSTLSGGQSKVPSTASNWSDIQKAVTDFDRVTVMVNENYEKFQGRVGQVRSLRSPKP